MVNTATGEVIPTEQNSSTTVTTTGDAGDLTEVSVVIGVPCTFTAVPSRIYVRTRRNGVDNIADVTAHLRLGYVTLILHEASSGFTVEVSYADGKQSFTYTVPAGVSIFRVPVQSRSENATISIEHDGPLSGTITGIDWEGSYTTRNRRF